MWPFLFSKLVCVIFHFLLPPSCRLWSFPAPSPALLSTLQWFCLSPNEGSRNRNLSMTGWIKNIHIFFQPTHGRKFGPLDHQFVITILVFRPGSTRRLQHAEYLHVGIRASWSLVIFHGKKWQLQTTCLPNRHNMPSWEGAACYLWPRLSFCSVDVCFRCLHAILIFSKMNQILSGVCFFH